MIGTIDVKCHAASQQIPLRPLYAFSGSPSSVRLVDVPAKIGRWRITPVARGWVATLDGCDTAGRTSGGSAVIDVAPITDDVATLLFTAFVSQDDINPSADLTLPRGVGSLNVNAVAMTATGLDGGFRPDITLIG